jgi:hypothetical protein
MAKNPAEARACLAELEGARLSVPEYVDGHFDGLRAVRSLDF